MYSKNMTTGHPDTEKVSGIVRTCPALSGKLGGAMYNEPEDSHAETASDPARRVKEKSDELRMYAELAAVFEGTRKFEAELRPGLDPDMAREVQRTMAKLAKAKIPDTPVISPDSAEAAENLLKIPATGVISTNDYHIYRRPGEVMIVRWLEDEQVETFYQRFQAHFDAGLEGVREDERQANEWKSEPGTLAYLEKLDELKVDIAQMYLRNEIRKHHIYVLSDQTADEMNIAYITETIMGATPADLVGRQSAPPDDPTEQDLTWFFKLFSLRGMDQGMERMCFFTYLQKADEMSFDE